MAFTVTPEADSEGNVVGFSTKQHQEGFGRFSQQDYIETDQGVKHLFQDVELADEDSEEFSEETYWQAVADLYPDTYQALEWAADNVPKELITTYNQAIDNDDRLEANKLLERIIGDYREAQSSPSEEAPTEEYNTLDDVSDDAINEGVNELLGSEPLGYDVAQEFSEAATEWLSSGHEVEAAILELANQFHQGSISASEAISTIINTYGDEAAIRAYQNLQ